jgi:hypothetical protein
MTPRFEDDVANAILGLDTLWGGDVMSVSGTGRFIADSWFSDRALPPAYTHAAAARLRESGGVAAKQPDLAALDSYLAGVDVPAAIAAVGDAGRGAGGTRGEYLTGLAESLARMWELAMELVGRGAPVAYEDCVRASAGFDPMPSAPQSKRERVRELLAGAGHATSGDDALLAAVDAWRKRRLAPMASVKALGAAFIAQLDALCERNLAPFLPAELREVPRANIVFQPLEDAWFSGFMSYLGRARRPDGRPEYEAAYEINAALEISLPEFMHLVSHEVVPGHVTTFAFLQDLWWRRVVGFEASVLTMNTRAATLFEGIANNAMLIAHGVTEVEELPDRDLQIGVNLALLQDDAKNQASYLTWREQRAQSEVAPLLRREFLVSDERADKLSGAWGRHPLLGRMCLPCYRAGTERVAGLRRRYPPDRLLPALYGARGVVDVVTIEDVLANA